MFDTFPIKFKALSYTVKAVSYSEMCLKMLADGSVDVVVGWCNKNTYTRGVVCASYCLESKWEMQYKQLQVSAADGCPINDKRTAVCVYSALTTVLPYTNCAKPAEWRRRRSPWRLCHEKYTMLYCYLYFSFENILAWETTTAITDNPEQISRFADYLWQVRNK